MIGKKYLNNIWTSKVAPLTTATNTQSIVYEKIITFLRCHIFNVIICRTPSYSYFYQSHKFALHGVFQIPSLKFCYLMGCGRHIVPTFSHNLPPQGFYQLFIEPRRPGFSPMYWVSLVVGKENKQLRNTQQSSIGRAAMTILENIFVCSDVIISSRSE